MKRFYCTVCKKVKRVRKWPLMIHNQESIDVALRKGACNRHFEQQSTGRIYRKVGAR